jgi:hypothetical protein
MIGLIGSTGLIGTALQRTIEFNALYSSTTVDCVCDTEFDTLWIAAPSGSRLVAVNNPDADTASVDKIIECLSKTQTHRIVLISTVDTVHSPETVYGKNRLRLEQAVKKFPDYYIVRLCTVIDNNIKKNLLFDLKTQQYLDLIKSDTVRQWYPLDNLHQDVQTAIDNRQSETNLVSPPIADHEIVNQFFPELNIASGANGTPYNITNNGNYTVTKQQVFSAMEKYFQ